jgi:hypothetical protein
MELQVWSKVGEKQGVILVLGDNQIHRIGVSGSKAGSEVPRIIDALHQGREVSAVGAGSVETLQLASIGRAEVSAEGNHVKFRAEGDNGATLEFMTSDDQAADVARAVVARTGRAFREEKQDIGPVEAVMPPAVVGLITGFFWTMFYLTAKDIERGEDIEVKGRRQGLKRLMIMVTEMLGVNGLYVVGALLLTLVVGWAVNRLVHRPQRTVWQLEQAA